MFVYTRLCPVCHRRVVCGTNLKSNLVGRPVAHQLKYNLLRYMNSLNLSN